MPEGIRGSFDGNAGDFNKTSGRQPLLILGALVAMYIVLGVLYESLAHPITIISTLPSAGLGALLALQVTNTPLTVIAFVGIILLIGIVKKNGIMMVDFALDAERNRGLSSADAIFEACSVRFRPILMTTMAALVRRHSAGDRHRPRHRTAPAARHHHHRRAVRVADPDAVHDAGDLPPDRPAAAAPPAGSDLGAGRIGHSRGILQASALLLLAFHITCDGIYIWLIANGEGSQGAHDFSFFSGGRSGALASLYNLPSNAPQNAGPPLSIASSSVFSSMKPVTRLKAT